MTMYTKPRWRCPFCNSAGFRAWWRWLVFDTNKLHACWQSYRATPKTPESR